MIVGDEAGVWFVSEEENVKSLLNDEELVVLQGFLGNILRVDRDWVKLK